MLPLLTMQKPPTVRGLLRGMRTNNIVQRMAAKQSFMGGFGRRRVEAYFIPAKSHTPECVKIEQFAATFAPVKSNVVSSRISGWLHDFLLRRQHRGFGTPDCVPILVKKRDHRGAIRVNCH